jgi:hypothetical protein
MSTPFHATEYKKDLYLRSFAVSLRTFVSGTGKRGRKAWQ